MSKRQRLLGSFLPRQIETESYFLEMTSDGSTYKRGKSGNLIKVGTFPKFAHKLQKRNNLIKKETLEIKDGELGVKEC